MHNFLRSRKTVTTTTEVTETTNAALNFKDQLKLKRLPVTKTTISTATEATLADDVESVTEPLEPEISFEIESTSISPVEGEEVTVIIDSLIEGSGESGLKF